MLKLRIFGAAAAAALGTEEEEEEEEEEDEEHSQFSANSPIGMTPCDVWIKV